MGLWAHPSKHTMLILSGHGSGILEPVWDESAQRWLYERDEGDSYYKRYSIRQNEQFFDTVTRLCDHKALFLEPALYATCAQIADSLQHVVNARGKKLDIIGFDMCHMAMLEIAYDIRNCAQIMIASQDCEEKGGWDYGRLVDIVTQTGLPTAIPASHRVARSLVYAYEKSQMSKEHDVFSLSALDLGGVDPLVQLFDRVVEDMQLCFTKYGDEFHDIVCSARQQNQQFCTMAMYADLSAFLETLVGETSLLITSDELEKLKVDLRDAIELLKMMIIANVRGESCALARGCSIYFPSAHIDTSYLHTSYACTKWLQFLSCFVGIFDNKIAATLIARMR